MTRHVGAVRVWPIEGPGSRRRSAGRRRGSSEEGCSMIVPLTPLEYKRRAVRNFGDKIGVVDGDRRFTYREFGERADRLAGALRGLDLAPGERVAFICYNTHHLLEGYYGVLQAGGVLTPINIRLASQEIAFVLDHCGAAVLCYHR